MSGLVAHVSRLTRSRMIETMQSQYVLAARAKGLPEKVVIRRHALRNALVPTITVLAIDVGLLMGGIVVVETVFSYPGLGRMLIFAIEQKDIPVVQAGILTMTAVYALANLAADLAVRLLQPAHPLWPAPRHEQRASAAAPACPPVPRSSAAACSR